MSWTLKNELILLILPSVPWFGACVLSIYFDDFRLKSRVSVTEISVLKVYNKNQRETTACEHQAELSL